MHDKIVVITGASGALGNASMNEDPVYLSS